ncbi:unnamed protein product [Camellia sinensis]
MTEEWSHSGARAPKRRLGVAELLRRAILGLKTKHKKSKKTNNHNNGSNTSKLGDSLKRKLLGLGREVVVQRSSMKELRQRRKLWKEEQAIVLLKYFGELGEDCSKKVNEICLIAEKGNKYWSGLLRDYYGPRAAIYFKFLTESSEKGDDFCMKDWRKDWIKLTKDWQSSRNLYPVQSNGDALDTSKWLYNKYLKDPNTYDH